MRLRPLTRAGNFRGLCPKIGRRSSCPSNKKIIGHARQRVHEFNRRKEHGKPEDPHQAQGL
ncbi:MAG: 30S ribosomal protein S30e [Clostridia bacterium]|nr:30S ribosomal protein S30e [Clostridia bacterium]